MTSTGFVKNLRFMVAASIVVLAGFVSMAEAQVSRFVGTYEGSAMVLSADGTSRSRDMSVEIEELKNSFRVNWTSTTYRKNGSAKEKSYSIEFVESDRDSVFAAAMRRNVFGHDVQLDPMKGEPYVWARLEGDTLSVYSIFVTETGGYEIQQFDRTLADGGLRLEFKNVRDGEILRTVSTFLKRQ